ncbi:DNA-repair protein rad2 [Coccidioides immitis RMSCC 3703]|uniref:DNA-repair protein rad2 n=1 Tax=Coccidioides immitis RMSCC 3703 TaxID=454286 RepID=A0A0J8QWG9_COCIT|nr:DNA-repair protein rad2 [Coccidioides immitis RMSCC 3703]
MRPTRSKSVKLRITLGGKLLYSMSIYSFLIAVRSDGQQLMNESGETTSHLMGFFYRTLRMVDNGIKPLYVFDGAPPKLKSGELAKRMAHAPTEAEAQCAVLARAGKVYAAASEDMDTLCFDSPILLRHLTFSEQRKEPIQEIHLERVLEGLGMDRKQFVDLCILLGCDYVDPIPKVGPNTALKMIRDHGSLEKVVEAMENDPKKKYTIPEDWPYEQARDLFFEPDVRPADHPECDFKWESPDVEGLVKFLVEGKGFSEDRVRSGAARLQKNLKTAQQSRLEGFFKPVAKTEEEKASLKRKHEEKLEAAKKKKKEDAKAKREARSRPKGTS